MLFIVFQIGPDRFAIDARQVAEILPLVPVRPVPQAPPGVAGVLNYRGEPLPVIDLKYLILGAPSAERVSTRILVVLLADGRRAGLIAERANETLRRNAEEFAATRVKGAPYLGPVTQDAGGYIQWVEPDKLVDGSVYAAVLEDAV